MSRSSTNRSSQSRLVLLGTGTCQLVEGRRASSVLLELDGLRLVYDLGRGIADRLAAIGLRQDDVRHIVFSHYHPDHISDLVPYLHAAAWSQIDARSEDLNLYGPPGLERQVEGVLELFGRHALVGESWQLHVREIDQQHLEIEGRRFDFMDLPPAGNRGLRFEIGGRRVALTGDSNFHSQEVDFLQGTDLAIFDSGHLSDEQIVELAVSSGARLLVCSHVYRPLELERLQAQAEDRGYRGKLQMGRDLELFSLRPWGSEGELVSTGVGSLESGAALG